MGEEILNILKAFPTAFGEGADIITGGRGQIKFFITTLSTSNIQTLVPASGGNEAHYTGSFSGAFSQSNRHIIPRVSGNINSLDISTSGVGNITYHGHLAPSGGLKLINSTFQMANASNIIIRHLTVRDGNTATLNGDDTMFFNRISNLIVDHVSLAWCGDEGISFFSGTTNVVYPNIIVQNSLIGQGRNGHNRGNITGTVSETAGEIRATFMSNLWVTFARTPNVTSSTVRAYNGVVYDWVGRTTNIAGTGVFDEINRYYKSGPNTITVGVDMINQFQPLGGSYPIPSIYTAGNIVEGYLTDPTADNRFQIWSFFPNGNFTTLPSNYFRTSPLSQTASTTYPILTAQEGYNKVVINREVGHNRSTNSDGTSVVGLDAIDTHYANAVQNGTNPILSESSFIHPSVPSTTAYTDSNFNGIADNFNIPNNSVYDDFEFFSAYMAGDLDNISTPTKPNVTLNTLNAFPGAIGFGKVATGGRNGLVLHVTNLNDSGEGSLRDALENYQEPRTIVFDVGGDIVMSNASINTGINVPTNAGVNAQFDGNISILGQTAPSPGIALKENGIRFYSGNNIIRYITIRSSDNGAAVNADSPGALTFRNFDLGVEWGSTIVDHVTLSHAGNENLAIGADSPNTPVRNFTISNSILGYTNGDGNALQFYNIEKSSWIKNYINHNQRRNPLLSGSLGALLGYETEYVNNINYGGEGGVSADRTVVLDFIGNIYKSTPNMGTLYYPFSVTANQKIDGTNTPPFDPQFNAYYVDNNFVDGYADAFNDQGQTNTGTYNGEILNYAASTRRVTGSGYEPLTDINDIKQAVFSDVGNSLYRDAYDQEKIDNYEPGLGSYTGIGKPSKVSTSRPAGFYNTLPDIPETFVQAHGITSNSQVITNWDFGTYTVTNTAGYSALEMYLAYAGGDLDRLAGEVGDLPTLPPVVNPSVEYKQNSNTLFINS